MKSGQQLARYSGKNRVEGSFLQNLLFSISYEKSWKQLLRLENQMWNCHEHIQTEDIDQIKSEILMKSIDENSCEIIIYEYLPLILKSMWKHFWQKPFFTLTIMQL